VTAAVTAHEARSPGMTTKSAAAIRWLDACAIDDLILGHGSCVLLAGRQLAIFPLRDTELYAIDNFDPIGKANVLARGIVGDVQGEPVVASPLFKQHFSLKTGRCLEQDGVSVRTYPVRCHDGRVEIGME
jgi:nitrite reductase (NADH) small subunit